MRVFLIPLLLLTFVSPSLAADHLPIDLLALIEKTRERPNHVSTPIAQVKTDAPTSIDPNFAAGNLKWDAAHQRYLSADGRYWAPPNGKWLARQWRTTPPEYREERYVAGKRCINGVCSPVYGTRRVQTAPARTVEVFGTSRPLADDPGFDASLPADQQPTPMAIIGDALRALNPRDKVFLDIGCGPDCRAGIVAARDFGAARVIAVEIDPEVAESARRHVAHNGLSHKVQVITADAADVEFPAKAVGFAYLWPDTLEKLQPQIQKLDRFVSFGHEVPGLSMRSSGDIFVYERPRPVMQETRPAGAVWNGRIYSGPKCNRRNCAMCNAIRAQLASWN